MDITSTTSVTISVSLTGATPTGETWTWSDGVEDEQTYGLVCASVDLIIGEMSRHIAPCVVWVVGAYPALLVTIDDEANEIFEAAMLRDAWRALLTLARGSVSRRIAPSA